MVPASFGETKMTMHDREIAAERFQDALDRQFMRGKISQAEYDRRVALLADFELGQITLGAWFAVQSGHAVPLRKNADF